LSQLKGIIFDLGSTLLEFESRPWEEITLDGQRRAYDHLIGSDHRLPDFETFNARLEEIKDEYRATALETLREWRSIDAFERILTEYGLEDVREQSVRSMEIFYELVREGFVLCEGANEVLEELKRRGYRTGLISNTIFPGYSHEVDLEHFDLQQYLDFRIYSSEFGYRKPHSAIYDEGLRRIGLPGSATMFVGDRYFEDVEGPQKHGMSAVLKYREGRKYPDPMPDGFPVIHALTELLDIVD
jgi:HAD superfamily hydrolase (TIGR01549 family)